MKVALVSGDGGRREQVSQAMRSLGHECCAFDRARLLLAKLRRDTFDLLLIDWRLPDSSGGDVLAWVRENVEHRVPILIIATEADQDAMVDALDDGADCYMLEPLRIGELKARTAALLRREYPAHHAPTNDFDDYHFDPFGSKVHFRGRSVDLRPKEYELAQILFTNAGRAMSRDRLIEELWGNDAVGRFELVHIHASRLRSKLGLQGRCGYRLITLYGFGYRLERIPVEAATGRRTEEVQRLAA